MNPRCAQRVANTSLETPRRGKNQFDRNDHCTNTSMTPLQLKFLKVRRLMLQATSITTAS